MTVSGMGAITATIWTNISAGEEIVADKTLYGCTFEFFEHHLSRFGVKVHFIEMTDEAQLRAALNDKTRIVYLETPANPNLKITDIEKTAKIAHDFNPAIKVICDNTFCSPYIQRPLELGADIVVHSATKYINGHGDLLAGFVVSDAETINQIRLVGIKDMTGAFMPANEAFLLRKRHEGGAVSEDQRQGGKGLLSRPGGSRGPRDRKEADARPLRRHGQLHRQGRP